MTQVKADPTHQPFRYPLKRAFVEPDWRRLPGYKDVTQAEWESALWQRQHSVKNIKELKEALGSYLTDDLAQEFLEDQKNFATMSLLIPPHMLNTMNEKDLRRDPVRFYMLPISSDRHPAWPNHPKASRDSLHESEMWAVEGLTHRYPTKVLAEIIATCPQYCGHCTRMDLVGNSVAQVVKHKMTTPPHERYQRILDYLRKTPSVRDVVVSGGDIANVPVAQLEAFVSELLDIPNIRDIRLASKALMAFRSTFFKTMFYALSSGCRARLGSGAWISRFTRTSTAPSGDPVGGQPCRKLIEMGFRDVRNQGVLLRGVNATAQIFSSFVLCLSITPRSCRTTSMFATSSRTPSIGA